MYILFNNAGEQTPTYIHAPWEAIFDDIHLVLTFLSGVFVCISMVCFVTY